MQIIILTRFLGCYSPSAPSSHLKYLLNMAREIKSLSPSLPSGHGGIFNLCGQRKGSLDKACKGANILHLSSHR